MPNKTINLQISLRDFYAGQALLGLAHIHPGFNKRIIAQDAFAIADEMIAISNTSKPSPWANAPEWARFIATDENGLAHYYEVMPVKGKFGWLAQKDTQFASADSYSFDDGWEDSLLARGEV